MTHPEYRLAGRLCVLCSTYRVRQHNPAHGFYNRAGLVFIDEQGRHLESATMPLGQFNGSATPTGRRLWWSGEAWGTVSDGPAP